MSATNSEIPAAPAAPPTAQDRQIQDGWRNRDLLLGSARYRMVLARDGGPRPRDITGIPGGTRSPTRAQLRTLVKARDQDVRGGSGGWSKADPTPMSGGDTSSRPVLERTEMGFDLLGRSMTASDRAVTDLHTFAFSNSRPAKCQRHVCVGRHVNEVSVWQEARQPAAELQIGAPLRQKDTCTCLSCAQAWSLDWRNSWTMAPRESRACCHACRLRQDRVVGVFRAARWGRSRWRWWW
jgi:hypothetical protein